METEASCDDPQFMDTLEACLSVEIQKAKDTLIALERDISESKAQVREQLRIKKDLKERTNITHENIMILSVTVSKQMKYVNELINKIELVKLNLDDNYKVMKLDYEQYEKIANEYENTWKLYHEKYNQFPLVKIRREAEIKLEKLRVEKMVLQFKISEFSKIEKLNQRITWMRMRGKIVELVQAISHRLQCQEDLKNLNKNIENSRERLKEIEAQLAAQMVRQEEEKKARALKVLEMPPPKIHLSQMRKLYECKRKTFLEDRNKNYENSLDTMSVDTLIFDEGCLADENSLPPHIQITSRDRADEDPVYEGQPIDASSLCPDQAQPEVEQDYGVSEVDGNASQEPIDTVLEEVEQRMDHEPMEDTDDPSMKRIRPIWNDESAVASPAKIKRLEVKITGSNSVNSAPKIRRIESVQYNFPSMMRLERSVHSSASSKLKQAIHQSPVQRPSKTSPSSKANQDSISNHSSVFTTQNFGYSEHSVLSTWADNKALNVKGDQISLDGQSVRDICECSNISGFNDDIEMESVVKKNTNDSSTSKSQQFPQFNFSNILGRNSNRSNLF